MTYLQLPKLRKATVFKKDCELWKPPTKLVFPSLCQSVGPMVLMSKSSAFMAQDTVGVSTKKASLSPALPSNMKGPNAGKKAKVKEPKDGISTRTKRIPIGIVAIVNKLVSNPIDLNLIVTWLIWLAVSIEVDMAKSPTELSIDKRKLLSGNSTKWISMGKLLLDPQTLF